VRVGGRGCGAAIEKPYALDSPAQNGGFSPPASETFMKHYTAPTISQPPLLPFASLKQSGELRVGYPKAAGTRHADQVASPVLTLREVFVAAIGPSARDIPAQSHGERRAFWAANPPASHGMYASWSKHARIARALADQVEDRLGADRDLLTISANDVVSISAAEAVSEKGTRQVDLLLRVCRWAEQAYGVSHGYRALRLPHGWRTRLAAGHTTKLYRPQRDERYSEAETGRLWTVLYDPYARVHPVLRDAVLFGGEQRLGQVLLTTFDDVSKVDGVWVFRPPQSGNKLTSWIIVPDALTSRFDAIMAAASARPDGRLFPRSSSTLMNAWRSLEQQAEVPHLGWFGLRRSMIDLCDRALGELTRKAKNPLARSGDIVLDAISAHRSTGVRSTRFIQSPVGDDSVPTQPSPMWDILVSAMRVIRRARARAMHHALWSTS
jgi:hypothetical protein